MSDLSDLPFVQAAVLCERVLCEVDGALSAIRITHEGIAAEGTTQLTLLLTVVRGAAPPGERPASLEIVAPSGAVVGRRAIVFVVDDGGAEQAASLVIDLAFEASLLGVYWFRIAWGADARLLTQVPYTTRAAGAAVAGAAHAHR